VRVCRRRHRVAARHSGAAGPAADAAASKVTSPQEQFGHNIGDDYFLVNYTQYLDYLKKMDAQSERMVVVDIGRRKKAGPR
jgi:hypothetical protein